MILFLSILAALFLVFLAAFIQLYFENKNRAAKLKAFNSVYKNELPPPPALKKKSAALVFLYDKYIKALEKAQRASPLQAPRRAKKLQFYSALYCLAIK